MPLPPGVRVKTYSRNGLELPSVTSVLAAVWPRPGLEAWKRRGVLDAALDMINDRTLPKGDRDEAFKAAEQRAAETQERTTARGKRVHAWAEAHVLGAPLPQLDPGEQGFADACLAFHKDHPGEFLASEMPVATDEYAGTLDLIKDIGYEGAEHAHTLVDYKTAAKKGPPYGDQAAQLGAYSLGTWSRVGEQWQATDLPTSCEAGAVVALYGDGTYRAAWANLNVARTFWRRAWEMWLSLSDEEGAWVS